MQSPEEIKQSIEYDLAEVKIIQELISTETNYNQSLGLLETAFSKDELIQDNELCNQFKLIIPQLKVISDKLLANVTSGVYDALNDGERLKLKLERFQLLKAFFHAYLVYPGLYDTYAREQIKFKALDTFIIQNTGKKFGLADLLSQPFQRGVRYKMLVTEALKSNKDLPEQYILELKQLEIFISDALKLSNSSMPAVKKPEPVSTSRFSIFGSSNPVTNTNTTPVSEDNQQGYRLGDGTRYLLNKYWYKQEAPVSELKVVAESSDETNDVVESGLKSDGPPTDLPPMLPDFDTSRPPNDLPPKLPEDLVLKLPFTEPKPVVDANGEVEDFDNSGNNFSM